MVSYKRFIKVAVVVILLWSLMLIISSIVSTFTTADPTGKRPAAKVQQNLDVSDIPIRMEGIAGPRKVSETDLNKRSEISLNQPVTSRMDNKYLPSVQTSIQNKSMNSKFCNKQKTTRIAFLKVPRSGSTTLENILYRFSMRHNLTMVLPKKNGNQDINDKGMLQVTEDEHWDILVTDADFNRMKFSRVLPKDVRTISIIRDPVERMISAAYYYRDVMKSPNLLRVPWKNFIVNLIRDNPIYEKSMFSNTKNSMAKVFGFPSSTSESMSKFITDYISQLTVDINLVLDAEIFDESLVLMKRYFNWDLKDILYIPANTHEHEPVSLSAEDVAKFKSISFLDYAIYKEFSKVLKRKIEIEQTVEDEVVYFKALLKSVIDFCANNDGSIFLHVETSRWGCEFIVTSVDCQYIEMDPRVVSKQSQEHT